MKKLSNINESIWGDIQRRGMGTQIKKEDGKKVSTCLGVDIIIKDSSCDYDYWIKKILSEDPNISYGVLVDLEKYSNLTPDEMINVRKFEAPYNYLIYDGAHGTSLVAGFYSYSELEEYHYEIGECVSEDDYISICRGIATKLKEVGEYFSHIPTSRNSYIINSNQNKLSTSYDGNYELKLIDEADVYNFSTDQESFEIKDFIYDICYEFKELEDEDFIGWSFRDYGTNIAIPLNYNNLVNFQKYEKFTQEWFNINKTNESIWGDVQRRGMGIQKRKEDEGNIKALIPVDIGCSVLWADRDLEIGGETELYIDQVKDLNMDGWRLPSRKEADELLSNTKWGSSNDYNKGWKREYTVWLSHKLGINPENKIYFNCEMPKYAEYWENEKDGELANTWKSFSFRQDGEFFPHSAYGITKMTDKCRVRLVKDK